MKKKILRGVVIAMLAILCFVLQTTLLKRIALANVVPNLLLILVVAISYMKGLNAGMATGMFCGLLSDFLYGEVVGMGALSFLLIGFLAGLAHKIYAPEDVTFPIILTMAGDFLYGMLYYVLHFLFRNRLDIGFYLTNVIVPELVYTVLVGALLYKPIQKLMMLLSDKQEEE